MKVNFKIQVLVLLAASLVWLPESAASKRKTLTINFCTFNISYDTGSTDAKGWSQRGGFIHDFVRVVGVDVLATQEGVDHQLADVAGDDYGYIKAGGFWNKSNPDISEANSQHLGIYWLKDKFQLKEQGRFWLSETPDRKSFGWDGAESRGCLWAKLKEIKTKKEFYVFCTHLDHKGKQARLNGAMLVLKKMKEIAGNKPVFWAGDFNGGPGSPHIKAIKADGFVKSSKDVVKGASYGAPGTFCGYTWRHDMAGQLDYVWVTSGIAVNKYAVFSEFPIHQPLSDHMPVMVNATF